MRYASVCSGIEAPSVAWEPLGWEPVWFSEIEPFPCAVLKHHYPDVPNHGDMTKIDTARVESGIDVLIGGTPCQSFSVAGLRGGLDDDRGNLALVYMQLVDKLRPRWVVWENVPGVLSSNGGRDFGAILGALSELGYGWAYRVLDAQWFGVPQRRRRVFLVGHSGGQWQRAAAVLFDSASLSGDPPPSREAREEATYNIAPCIGASGRGFARVGDPRGQDAVVPQPYPVANCLTRRMGKGINTTLDEDQTPVVTQYGENLAGTLTQRHDSSPCADRGQNVVAFQERGRDGGRSCEVQKNVAYSLNSGQRGGERQVAYPINGMTINKELRDRQTTGIGASDDPCPSLRACGHQHAVAYEHYTHDYCQDRVVSTDGVAPALNVSQQHQLRQDYAVRRLTPIECERLQGFPDNYTRIPWRGKPAEDCPDTPRYKALGNSMATPVVRWIGERITMEEEDEG